MADQHSAEDMYFGRTSTFRFRLSRLRHNAAQFMDRFPRLFLRVFHRGGTLVNSDTEILMDGYPRSANTFACCALDLSQARKVRRAGFKHYSSHIILGVKMGKPVVVLVRDPEEAALSLLVGAPYLTIREVLHRWIVFHKRVKPYRKRFVVATFDQLTTDFGSVLERVNRKFGTNFRPFEHSDENIKQIFSRLEAQARDASGRIVQSHVCRPSELRNCAKETIRPHLLSPKYEQLRREARRLYEEFISYANEWAHSLPQAAD